MHATTIKLEGKLLDELEAIKPSGASLTSYVRDVLENDIRRHKLVEAAAQYEAFVGDHPGEKAWLDEWDTADLSRPPKHKGVKK